MMIQSVKMAWEAIISNKMRSFLTMLGIIIGVVSLVVLVSLVDGATGTITDEVAALGNDMLTVSIMDDKGAPIRLDDLSQFTALSEVEQISPSGSMNATAKYQTTDTTVSVYGVNVAISIPGLLVDTIICIVSTIFILLDWEIIRDFIYHQLPEKTTKVISHASHQLGRTLRQYILSYGLIVLMTFTEISLGLWLTGIQNAFVIGALIALVDILPIVGSGAILLPWCIISFICGNVHNGICILLVYIVVTVVRNIVEPKVVGKQVGLHPLVTLLSMVIGASAFGGVGVLALPVTIAVAKKLNDDHVIDIIKKEREINM